MKKTLLSKLILGGAILFSLPLLFSSCGNEDNPAVNPTPTPTPTPEGISYKAWNAGSTFDDKAAATYTEVTSSTTTWSEGTYVVNSDVTIDGDVTLSGDVNLILCDGKTLTVNGSIQTEFDGSYNPINSLAVYAQSGGTGALNITPSVDVPGIYAKNLNIHGGVISATVIGNEAGLESSNEMNIYAGTIITAGGNGIMNYGPNVLSIYNADITATGITNGIQSATGIMMYSGSVMAMGGDAASGTNYNGNSAISTAALTVNGGTLFAKGGAADGTGSNGTGIDNTASISLGTGITFYEGTTILGMAAVVTTPVTCSQQFVRIE